MVMKAEHANAKVIEQWACEKCHELYDDRGDAGMCCPPEPERAFVCSVCEDAFETPSGVSRHVHGELLKEGATPLAEWATAMEMEARSDF